MYRVQDWAVQMSRTTVLRLLELGGPPRYQPRREPSLLDPFKKMIAWLLEEDPKVPATVLIGWLRADG